MYVKPRPNRRNKVPTNYSSNFVSKKTSYSGNTAVKNVYKKSNTAPKSKSDTNQSAIATLAKQVKILQLKEAGNYQRNLEHCSITGGLHAWTTTQPICFAMNNMLNESQVFMGVEDNTAQPGTTLPGHLTIQNWHHTEPFSIYPEYSYWSGANDDHANPQSYRPIGTTITLNFEAPSLAPNKIYWCRADIVKVKKVLKNTTANKLGLPENIQSLSNLASDSMSFRNRYNREYFTVLKTYWCKLENNSDQDKTIEKFIKIYFKFPDKKSTTEKLGADEHRATSVGEVSTSFFSQMPQDEIYWMILSTSNNGNPGDTNHVKLQMSRFISYRDKFGYST